MVSLRSLFIFTSAVTALSTLSRRDPRSVLSSLNDLDSSINALKDSVSNWDGQLDNANDIQSKANDVSTRVDDANRKASNERMASDSDSQMIIDYLNNNLVPDVRDTMNTLKDKKDDFDNIGMSSEVASSLRSMHQKDSDLISSLLRMSSDGTRQDAQQATDEIDQALSDAESQFSDSWNGS